MKTLLSALAIVLFCSLASAQGGGAEQPASGSGDVVIFVFDGDEPVPGAQLLVDGTPVATTGDDGGLFTSLSAGRHKVIIQRDGESVVDLDLLTADGEQIQLIATLKQGQKPEINIESTGSGPVLATDVAGESGGDGEQPGLLKGVIVGANGNPIENARVFVPSRGRAARTDTTGLFQIELPPGNYSIQVTHPDYSKQSLDNLRVIPGKTVTADLSLGNTGVQLADYVVTGTYVEGSIASELSIQRDSPQVVSVIGAEQIARTGDGDAAEALQRVSGLVIERNRFVVIRGQPFRYTLTHFNGLPLPSPDPIIQAVPLDLFPDAILANIQVQKSYSVDQPGDFGAGLIGLNTIGTPDESFLDIKVSSGGNDFSTGKDGLTYEGSVDDVIGEDSGQRALPSSVPGDANALSNLPRSQQAQVGRDFNDVFLPESVELPADAGLEVVGGTAIPTDFGTYGVLATVSYDQKFRNEQETDNELRRNAAGDLVPFIFFDEERTDREVQISSLLGLSGKWDNHLLKSNSFFIRDSQDRTQISEGTDDLSGGRDERRFLLEFQRRELALTQLLGEHDFDFVKIDWRGQLAETKRRRPDRRDYSYQRDSASTSGPLVFNVEDNLERQFNETDESVNSLAADFRVPVDGTAGWITEVSAGFDITERERDSQTRRFEFRPQQGAVNLGRPFIEQIINDFTIDDDGDVVSFAETTLGSDTYTADASTSGVYLATNLRYQELIEAVVGLRRTEADFAVQTTDPNTGVGGFTENFFLPSLSITAFVTPDIQFRAAASKTVSYPRLVELAEGTIFFDPDTGEDFIGAGDLQPTEIQSYDLRAEWYPTALEALTFGVFYKQLDNTVEQQFVTVGGGGTSTTFVNGNDGEILGVEFGGRMSLGRINDLGFVPGGAFNTFLSQSYVQANLAFTDSEVEVPSGGAATNTTRALTGQADSVLNLQLGYDGAIHDVTLVLNRIGERLDSAGVQGRPDVFQEPSTFLDLTYSIRIPEQLPFIGKIPFVGDGQIKFKGRNLLDEESEFRQGGVLRRRIISGRSFSGSLSWNFF